MKDEMYEVKLSWFDEGLEDWQYRTDENLIFERMDDAMNFAYNVTRNAEFYKLYGRPLSVYVTPLPVITTFDDREAVRANDEITYLAAYHDVRGYVKTHDVR